ncbi:hypothetical protein N9188_00145 [bacterium]|nr:hypothetical protein [bacterium]
MELRSGERPERESQGVDLDRGAPAELLGAGPPSAGPPSAGPPTAEPSDAPAPWPPPFTKTPRFPLVPEREAPLRLDPSSLPVPDPEFTPTRLPSKTPQESHGEHKVQAAAFDRRNPSGRTRRDRVLRPTAEDRGRAQVARRLSAVGCGILVVALTTPLLASLSFGGWLLMTTGGALAGLAALETTDSEASWPIAMAVLGSLLGLFHGPAALAILKAPIGALAFALTGWLMGKLREIHNVG